MYCFLIVHMYCFLIVHMYCFLIVHMYCFLIVHMYCFLIVHMYCFLIFHMYCFLIVHMYCFLIIHIYCCILYYKLTMCLSFFNNIFSSKKNFSNVNQDGKTYLLTKRQISFNCLRYCPPIVNTILLHSSWAQLHNNLIRLNFNPKYFRQNYTFFSQIY